MYEGESELIFLNAKKLSEAASLQCVIEKAKRESWRKRMSERSSESRLHMFHTRRF